MYCSECGMQIPEDASFCPRCGRFVSFQGNTYTQSGYQAPQTESVHTYSEPQYYTGYDHYEPQKRRWPNVIVVIVVAAIVLAVLFFPFGTEKGELNGRSFSHPYEGSYADSDYRITYSWEYLDGKFAFDIPISQEAIVHYRPFDPNSRTLIHYSDCVAYVEDIYGVSSKVLDALNAMYKEAFGKDPVPKSQSYADFILAYVQGAFAYEYDATQYGVSEYFAYPVETLFSKKGDCEDTSVLCAMLYELAGFNTAILIIPEHAMVGVALEEYVSPDCGSGEILHAVSAGKTFYAGETTVDDFQPVGVNYHKYNNKLLSRYIYADTIGTDPVYIFYEVNP